MLSQHLIGMLAQRGRCSSDSGVARRILHRRIDEANWAAFVMLDLDHHVPGSRMVVVERGLDIVDRGIWQPLALEDLQPLLSRPLYRYLLNQALQLPSVGHTLGIGLVFGVFLPQWLAQAIAQDAKQAVVASPK